VSEDIANEVLDRVFDADETLSDDTKRFVDRHVTFGEGRPAAADGEEQSGRWGLWRLRRQWATTLSAGRFRHDRIDANEGAILRDGGQISGFRRRI
jgi:hypothetical protein